MNFRFSFNAAGRTDAEGTQGPATGPVTVRINPERVLSGLIGVIAILGLLHVVTQLCWRGRVCGVAQHLVDYTGYMFELSTEMNLPTWFSVVQLAAVALALVLAALTAGRGRAGWWGLVVLFLYMSLDELTDLHGFWILFLGDLRIEGIYEGFNWVVPGAVFVLAIAAAYGLWVLRLPKRTRWLFVLAGVIFVTGGLGFEVLGLLTADVDFDNLLYVVVATFEELLEMLGIAIMLYAVLDHLRRQGGGVGFDAA